MVAPFKRSYSTSELCDVLGVSRSGCRATESPSSTSALAREYLFECSGWIRENFAAQIAFLPLVLRNRAGDDGGYPKRCVAKGRADGR